MSDKKKPLRGMFSIGRLLFTAAWARTLLWDLNTEGTGIITTPFIMLAWIRSPRHPAYGVTLFVGPLTIKAMWLCKGKSVKGGEI